MDGAAECCAFKPFKNMTYDTIIVASQKNILFIVLFHSLEWLCKNPSHYEKNCFFLVGRTTLG